MWPSSEVSPPPAAALPVLSQTEAMRTWSEPARDLPILGHPDVLVVGAGSAGVSAAVAAARRGAETWLIERYPFVGGLATYGLINLLLTLDDGQGQQVVRGICQEVVDRLDARGEARFPPAEEWNSEEPDTVENWRRWGLIWGAPPEAVRYSVAFEPEPFADVCVELLEAAGVNIRLHRWCVAAYVRNRRIEAVVVESKAGREAILPTVVIDASGDGDVLVAAGAAVDRVAIPPYLWFRAGNVAIHKGRPGRLWFETPSPGRALVAFGPLPGRVDACDPDDLTRAELAGRAAARQQFGSLRESDPAFAEAWLDDYARLLGITESRRLVGDHVMAKEEGDVPFADSIARTGHWTRRGVIYHLPYRCLTTSVAANLLAAGRCISTTRYVHQATKEIPAAMATGEAAGAAAAHALGSAGDVRSVDVSAVRRDLRAAGADVGGPASDAGWP